jgi:hypothetical protein
MERAMELPGGINIDGVLKRSFRFKPVTGGFEMMVGEGARDAGSLPARVTAILSAALAELGGASASIPAVRSLCVGDRQFLMTRLAAHIEDQDIWLTGECHACGELFDVSLRYSVLPVKPAGAEFPETTVETELGSLRVRVPTGADQEAVAAAADETAALNLLLRRLLSTVDPSGTLDIERLSDEDIAAVEARLEAMAPEIAARLQTRCPSCGTENQLPISPYTFLQRPVGDIYSEIHLLASTYHWSESDILALPRARRRIYLQMIDQSRGMKDPQAFIEESRVWDI